MFIFRTVRDADLNALLALAAQAGGGLTTFKPELSALRERIDVAVRSFAGELAMRHADYVFVLEDSARQVVVGISALKASVGLNAPFYNFRVGRLVHSSRELGIYADKRTLYLTNDFTGCAELCTLFLDPSYRAEQNGRLLSKARMMFMANHMALIPDIVIAELRGYQREDGTSPFWESLGRHFFRMDFDRADDISGLGQKSFIAELMPRFPVYTDFLTEEARQAIGLVHTSTKPAQRLLEQEGFTYEGYVDIFDAGPVLQSRVKDLRLVRDSRLAIAAQSQTLGSTQAAPLLVSNTSCADFRAIVAWTTTLFGRLALSPEQLLALGLRDGDPVRYALLNPQQV
jgi:arginine N-succinyltransferase